MMVDIERHDNEVQFSCPQCGEYLGVSYEYLEERTCFNVHEPPIDGTFWPSPHFKCSLCGNKHISMDYVFYCPNCGAKVVD